MVDVNTQNKTISVNVSSSGVSSNVNASGDTTLYYSNKAREWAISNRIVDGVDYSSKYYAGRANQSALNAQSFAQSALETLNNVDNKVQEATENIESQKQDVITEIEDLSEQEQNKIVDLGIDTRADIDLSNLSSVGEKHFLNKSQITNCITEIPQRIKYTLENGTFTLLKGSVMIFPHGTTDLSSSYPVGSNYYNSNFKVVDRQFANGLFFVWAEIQADKTISQAGSITRVGNILYVNAGSDAFGFNGDNAVTSGTTKPTSGQIWYDTTNNIFYNSSDGFSTYTQVKISFPICTFAREAGVITNINQVFNGMGYIGSTQWYDKDIVGLSPNGLNSDGTYNNVEIRRTRLTVRTFSTDTTPYNWQLGSSAHRDYKDYYVQDTQPALSGNWLWYDTLNNKLYGYSSSTGLRDMSGTYFIGGFGTRTNGVVTSFNPKQPFRAVDWYDLEASINDLEIGIEATVPAGTVISSAKSSTPAGYLYCNGSAVSRTTYAKLFSAIGTTYGTGDGSTTFNLPNYSNYNFVTSATVSVKGNGKALGFYDNKGNYGGGMRMYGGNGNAYVVDGGYGKAAGTTGLAATSAFADGILTGVTTDAAKSGLTGTVTTKKLNWYIKY